MYILVNIVSMVCQLSHSPTVTIIPFPHIFYFTDSKINTVRGLTCFLWFPWNFWHTFQVVIWNFFQFVVLEPGCWLIFCLKTTFAEECWQQPFFVAMAIRQSLINIWALFDFHLMRQILKVVRNVIGDILKKLFDN